MGDASYSVLFIQLEGQFNWKFQKEIIASGELYSTVMFSPAPATLIVQIVALVFQGSVARDVGGAVGDDEECGR